MFIGRITGSIVSTQKVDELIGRKLLIVEPLRVNEEDETVGLDLTAHEESGYNLS